MTLNPTRTCNEAAAALFPGPRTNAFQEYEANPINEPGYLQLLDLNDDFWACTLANVVYVAQNQFFQYNPNSGIYEQVTESTLIGQLTSNLNLASEHFPSSLKFESFQNLKTRARLKAVVERARDLLSVSENY